MNPLEKKNMLIKKFKEKPIKEKLLTVEELKLEILPETFEWFRKVGD